jgi:hypothetical protein
MVWGQAVGGLLIRFILPFALAYVKVHYPHNNEANCVNYYETSMIHYLNPSF